MGCEPMLFFVWVGVLVNFLFFRLLFVFCLLSFVCFLSFVFCLFSILLSFVCFSLLLLCLYACTYCVGPCGVGIVSWIGWFVVCCGIHTPHSPGIVWSHATHLSVFALPHVLRRRDTNVGHRDTHPHCHTRCICSFCVCISQLRQPQNTQTHGQCGHVDTTRPSVFC